MKNFILKNKLLLIVLCVMLCISSNVFSEDSTLLTTSKNEIEPNDKPGIANIVEINTSTFASIQINNDNDWYKVFINSPGRIQLSVLNPPIDIKSHIALYNKNLEYLYVTASAVNQGDDVHLTYDATTPGFFYIQIKELGGNLSNEKYQFKINFTQVVDNFEPNNSIGDSKLISSSSVNGYIFNNNDTDWYKIYLDNNDELKLKLLSPMEMKSNISIYDSNFSYMYVNSIAANSGDTVYLNHTFEKHGLYYIRVKDNNSISHIDPYVLEITGGRPGYEPQDEPITNENEPNDYISTANFINIGSTITGIIQETNDKDIFKLQTLISGQLIVKLDTLPDNLQLKILLYNSSNQHILSAQSSSPGDSFSIIYDTTEPEILYLKIEDLNQEISEGPYSFSTNFISVPDEFEPNNNFGEAALINNQNRISGYVFKTGDYDWYKIHVSKPGELKIIISDIPKNIRPEINFYNSSKENLSGKTGISGMDIELVYSISLAGDYYVRFHDNGNNDESTKTYTMTILGADFNLFAPVSKIDSVQPGSIVFGNSITFSGSGDDLDGEILEYSWRSNIDGFLSSESTFSSTTLSKGTHNIYFKVLDNSGIWSTEESKVVYVGSNVSDESESNNKIGQSNEIAINYPLTSKIQEKGDIDWFKVFLNEVGRLKLSLTNVPDNLRLYIKLYNRHTEYLYSMSQAVSEGDSIDLLYDATEPGIYYIKIGDASGNFSSDFTYTFLGTFVSAVDPQEPNNSILNAFTMTENSLYGLIFPSNDIDYYSIWVKKDSPIEINLSDIAGEMKGHMYLYGRNHNYLYVSTQAQNPGDLLTLEYTPTETGYLYIVVKDTLSSAYVNQMYRLTVSGANPEYLPPEIPATIELEPDDTIADANFISFDIPISGKFETVNDNDYFYFSMPFPGILNTSLENLPENIRPYIRILKSDKTQINYREATNPGDTLNLNTIITIPGKYYIHLKSIDQSTISDQSWTLKLSATQITDPNEPNNKFGDASYISEMNLVQAYIFDTGDIDWYKISVDNPGTLQVTITDVPLEIRPQIEIYNNNNERLATKMATNNGQELMLECKISEQGIYFFRVFDNRNNTFSTNPYTLIVNGASFDSFTPQAYIDIISPSIAQESESILFEGHGFDEDGDILAYSWRSSVDDHISDSRVFSLDNLSIGPHTIYFKVKDNDQNWSPETSTLLYVGVSAPQEHEPNNTIGESNFIEYDVIYPGSIEKSGDNDFYQIKINQPGRLTLKVTNPTGSPMKTRMDIYNPNADYTYVSEYASNSGDPVTLIQDFTYIGIYYIRVKDLNNNTDSKYSITASFVPVPDPYEPNSDIQTAKTISPGDIINAWIFPSQDQDWYKIKLEKPGTLTLSLTDVPSDLKGHISIYNDNNQYTYITGIASNDGDNVICTFHTGSPGTYFIKFYNQNSKAIPGKMYKLSVDFREAFDIFEPNSGFRTASWLNNTPIDAYLFPSGDIDYYAFFAEKDSNVQINIDNVPQELKMKIDLYNKDWGYLYVTEKASMNGASITLNYDVGDTGIYYIKVSDQNSAFSSESQYRLSISGSILEYSLPVEPLNQEHENNDKYWSANPIGFNTLSGSFDSVNDQDWYRIVLSEKGLLKINLNVSSNVQSKIELYQLSTSRIAENKGESQTLTYSVSELEYPFMYIKLSNENNTMTNGSYDLRLEFDSIIDSFEPNEYIGSSAPINPGTIQNAYIFPTGDNDWYEINIEQAGILKIEFQDVPDNIEIKAYLYNRNKNSLTGKQALNSGDPIDFSYHISEPGKYYISIQDVDNNAQSSSKYSFMVYHNVINDQNEPNSSFSNAKLIENNNLVDGTIFPENDYDWYKFYVYEPGEIRIQLTESFGIDANLELYNDSKVKIKSWTAKNIGDLIDVIQDISVPDYYYIRLNDTGNNNISIKPYKLTVSKISCENSFPFASIKNIEPNPVLTGGYVEFIGNGFDSDGEHLSYEWKSNIDGDLGNTKILKLNNLSKGKHIISLRVKDSNNNFSATVNKNLYVLDSIQYEKEYNNTLEKAIPVSINEWIKGRIYPATDIDYYKFFIPQRGLLETIIDVVPQNMSSSIYFYDENGTYTYKTASSINPGDRISISFFAEPGWYYSKINDKTNTGHQSEYALIFKYTQAFDQYEPANTISMAKEIDLNSEFSDAIICPESDIDWYKLNISEPGRLLINLFNLPENMKISVDIYNQDLSYLYINKQAKNNGENVNLSFDTKNTGLYYIRIRDINGLGYTSPYTFKNIFTPVIDDNEPDNTFGDATQIKTNEIESFIFPNNDIDYYRIFANKNDELYLSLSGPDNMKGNIAIYNYNFSYTYSAEQANNNGDNLYLSYTIPTTGFYYIKINDINNNSYLSPYLLKILGIDLDNVPQFSPVISEVEPNGEHGLSNDIALDTDIKGNFELSNDYDWFRFYINSPGILRISHTNIPDQIRSEIWLYDVNKGQLNYRTTTNDSEDNILVHSITNGGYYYIKVHDHGGNNNAVDEYNLHLSHIPVVDSHEPNNSYGLATQINTENIQAYIFDASDEDWYRFYMREKGVVSISLNTVPENIRPHIKLYDSEKKQLSYWLATNSGQTGTDLITYNIETPGYYFIKFYHEGKNADSNEPYSINISGVDFSTAPQLAPIGDRIIDPGINYSFILNATDPDNPDDLVYSAANLPPGSTFDPDTGLFSWLPVKDQAGNYPGIHFEVSDNTYSDKEDIMISVRDVKNPPILNPIGNKTIVAEKELKFIVSGSAPDDNDSNLIFSAKNLPKGSEFDLQTNTFSWVPSQNQIAIWPNVCFEISNGTWTDFEYINIEVISEVKLPGDFNSDGKIDMQDVILLIHRIF
ncbi:Peptidase domain protein [Candidatus Magnetomorum sp. HK-1]|nr:Peptidase domain protein [Candidatus Magnetomorum sp. HK-1]